MLDKRCATATLRAIATECYETGSALSLETLSCNDVPLRNGPGDFG
jgi:hypothetical protein